MATSKTTVLQVRTTIIALLGSALAATPAAAQETGLPADRAKGAAQVTVEQTKTWLYKLASEEFAGRGTGQEGFRLAAEYMRDQFQAMGLRPGGDNQTYFQTVPWSSTEVDLARSSLTFIAGDEQLVIPGPRLSGTVSGPFELSGEVVLVTDVEALPDSDVAGKIVVGALGDSGDQRRRGGGSQFQVMRTLQGKDQKGLLFARTDAPRRPLSGRSGRRGGNRAVRGARRFPGALSFGGEDLTALLELCGRTLADKGAFALEVSAELRVQAEEKDAPAYNVVAILPGAGPAPDQTVAGSTKTPPSSEYVVIGSHLDHLGRRGDNIYPGADDDASGTTGVLAVAKMFTENPTRPGRSILFVGFCGEERGLVGSSYFVNNPPIPLESIVGELQMDMIGRDEEANAESRGDDRSEKAEDNRNTLHLIGTRKLAPLLHEICLQKNGAAGFELEWDQEGMFGRSDHANFARLGVPVAFFFTGLHGDYHRMTDTPDKIHFEKLLRVATYVYDIAFELAQLDSRPEIDPALWQAYRGKRQAEPAAPMSQDGK